LISIPKISDLFVFSCVVGVGISYGNLYLFHILFTIIIIFALRNLKFDNYIVDLSFFSTRYIYMLPVFFGWYFLSIFWSINKLYTLQYLFYIFCGSGITFIFIKNNNSQKKLKKVTNFIGKIFCVEIIFSLLESLTSFRLPISPFSNIVSFFGREPSLQPTLDSFALPSIIQPPTGFQWNPNDLAIAMLIIVPFFLFLKQNFLKLIAISSILIIIIMTSSRSVLLSVGLLFIIYLIFYKKQIASVSLVILSTMIFFSQLEIMKDSENQQISDIANTFSAIKNLINDELIIGQSLSIRKDLAANGINALKSTYGLGVGGGGSIAVQERYGGVDGRITSMHNFWLEILVDAGILFALIFFLWYGSLTFSLYKVGQASKSKFSRYLGKSISLSMIIFVPASISASSVIYFFPMWLLFGFAISTLETEKKIRFE